MCYRDGTYHLQQNITGFVWMAVNIIAVFSRMFRVDELENGTSTVIKFSFSREPQGLHSGCFHLVCVCEAPSERSWAARPLNRAPPCWEAWGHPDGRLGMGTLRWTIQGGQSQQCWTLRLWDGQWCLSCLNEPPLLCTGDTGTLKTPS